MAELEQNSACSEDTNSICDEERVRKLFQACDTDGDGYIDSQDLLTVCRELNLEGSLEELMRELGADESGRISYEEFQRRRLALRPQIDALRTITPPTHPHHHDYLPTSSDNSLGAPSGGKHESWEFDSGARDLSPEPNTLARLMEAAGGSLTATNTASLLQLANKLHLAALASLRGEIHDLTSRLQAVTDERDLLEKTLTNSQVNAESIASQQYEERITELHSVIAELSRKLERQRTMVITEEEDALSEAEQSADTCSQTDACRPVGETEEVGQKDSEVLLVEQREDSEEFRLYKELSGVRAENASLQAQMVVREAEIARANACLSTMRNKLREAESCSPTLPPHMPPTAHEAPVLRIAERVKLRRMDRHITGPLITSLGVSHTAIAEHLVSELQGECDLQERRGRDGDRALLEADREKLSARLEHTRAHNTVLQLTLEESKGHCERLSLLVGKFESNATALRLALNSCDQAIEAYSLLVGLLQSYQQPNDTSDNKRRHEEAQLLRLIEKVRAERERVGATVVQLESHVDWSPGVTPTPTPAEARKLDLETAVLMQEVMAMREDKAELKVRLGERERDRERLMAKVAALEYQLQAQYQDNSLTQEEGADCCDKREQQLRERLKQVASMLERVSLNAELKQKHASELTEELKAANSVLTASLERCKRKSQARLRRLETQMLGMMERHAAQVRTLKQRIQMLEETHCERQSRAAAQETVVSSQSQSSGASETSL